MIQAPPSFWVRLLGLVLLVSGSAAFGAEPSSSAQFIGAAACGSCHEAQFKLWQGSHHGLAMQPADARSVLGDFNQQSFQYDGVVSRFYRKGEGYFVRTDGADGKLAEFQVKYTFGVYPLQQYLIEFPDGRVQALGVAWDSRPKADGGQRWMHVYPGQHVKAGETIHWTGIDQNWNHMCAECHSTNLRKNFDLAKNRFATTWSEIDVACEACHGPGSQHAEWAKQPAATRGADDRLPIKLTEAMRPRWTRGASAATAQPEQPIAHRPETDLCARCHSRRSELTEDYVYGHSLLDTHAPELLTAGRYYPDGRMQDEVYNYGSFLQSKMHRAGVACNDCHEPHSLKLRAESNAVCAQCHDPGRYDGERHHFHKQGSKGALCSECHMPASIYMAVDRRHDHGFRVPRPDLSLSLGVPNACNDCHQDKQPEWALAKLRAFYGHAPGGYQDYAATLKAARDGVGSAWAGLNQLALNANAPPIARATALWELRNYLGQEALESLRKGLEDADPVVRLGAAQALADAEPPLRKLLLAVAADPVRAVRATAGKGLAAVPAGSLPPDQRGAAQKAMDDYVASQQANADRPEAQMNLGVFYADAGRFGEAEAAYRAALKLRPDFTPAYANLADSLREQGRDADAERLLRAALKQFPKQPELRHALGLLLVRAQRLPEALKELESASRLGKGNARFDYVYAVALHSVGATEQSLKLLDGVHRRFPNDQDVLLALVDYNRALGRDAVALRYAKRLATAGPQAYSQHGSKK